MENLMSTMLCNKVNISHMLELQSLLTFLWVLPEIFFIYTIL